jgi:regulator of protease activity HflC (stomatin/prohibitin superfamily)
MGRRHWIGEYRAAATLIVVERKPVSRSWESGSSTADSSNRAIFGGSSDNIGIYVGMNCTAMIEEQDAAKFLYRYNNTPLETIIDTDIKKMVEDRFNVETAKYTSTELGAKKGEIMDAVKSYVVDYFKEYGITITVLGLKEDISYENPAIQDAIDKRFASEQDLEIQKNKNEANIAKAEAEANAMIMLAEAQAEANRLLSESLDANLLEKMYYEKWDGALPYIYGEGATPIVQVPVE